MNKKKIISIFYIFIIFNSNLLIKSCQQFSISKDMFHLNDFYKNPYQDFIFEDKYNLDLLAFKYTYLKTLDIKTMQNLINYYKDSLDAEKKEIKLFGLINFVKNNMKKIGFDIFSSEEQLEKTKSIIKTEINMNTNLDENKKGELLEQLKNVDIRYKENEKNIKSNILDMTVTTGSIAFSYLAVSFLNLALIPSSLLIMTMSLGIGATASALINSPYEEQMKIALNKVIRARNMLQTLYYKISNIEWKGNNLIMTATSNLDNCLYYDIMFIYDDKIYYNEWYDIVLYMVEKTCFLKRNVCTNRTKCEDNVLDYVECFNQKKKGINRNCPYFRGSDCSLKNYKREYDL